MWRWSVLRQSGHRSEGLDGDGTTGRKRASARAPRLVFTRKVAEETVNSSAFSKRDTVRGKRGMGNLGEPRKPKKCAFIRCVMTLRIPPMAVSTCCWREGEGEGHGGGSTCEATPASTGDGFISRSYNRHGSRGCSPIARNTTHMARPLCPSLPPPPRWQGGVCHTAPFSKSLLCIWDLFCCRRAAAVLPSHVTHISAQEEHGLKRKKTGKLDQTSTCHRSFFLKLFFCLFQRWEISWFIFGCLLTTITCGCRSEGQWLILLLFVLKWFP